MRRFAEIFLAVCMIGSPCWADSLAAPTNAADIRPCIEPGMEYRHEWIGNGPWSIHIVKLDRSRKTFQLAATLAQDHIYGLVPMTGQIEHLATATRHPVAAINGDFFHIRPGPYQGDPLGLQIANGELVSSPTGASFWVAEDGSLHMGEVKAEFRATGPNDFAFDFGLNEERPADAAVLYTPAIGDSTRTEGGIELLLEPVDEGHWLPSQTGERYRARIAAIGAEGDTRLSPNVMILSIGPELAAKLPVPAVGQMITLDLKASPDLKGATTALGGGPILLREGRTRSWEHRPERHPRTAIGWSHEHLFLVVVDGRQAGLSIGMNYTELSALMLRLGCTEAMNLDGGGSSTLWLGGCVMNSPSDGRQRAVANGLVIMSAQQAKTP